MKLSYQLATISYCPDLTDPAAVSVPIAVLAVGKTSNDEGFWSAGIVGVDAKRMGIDPLSSAMLADVPHMIRRHVREKAQHDLAPGLVLGCHGNRRGLCGHLISFPTQLNLKGATLSPSNPWLTAVQVRPSSSLLNTPELVPA